MILEVYLLIGTLIAMVRISKHKLKDKVWDEVWGQCIDTILSQKNHTELENTLEILLTKTERVMFAKRVAMIVMVRGGYSVRATAVVLHASPNTVFRWKKRLETGEFSSIERHLAKPDVFERILATIELLIHVGMPPIAGRNRIGRAMKRIEKAREKGSCI